MGISSSELCKTDQIDISKLKFIKKTVLGSYYKQKQSINQLLLIETLTDPSLDIQSSKILINKHLTQRISIKNKNIPQIISLKNNNNNLCSFNNGLQIWMIHPLRSLKQQLIQRQNTNQIFGQGQIWMIIYSTLNALVAYQQLAQNIIVNSQNIYISQTGDVILSDANLYKQSKFYLKSQRIKQINENINKLNNIIKQMMKSAIKIKFQYSKKLYNFIKQLEYKQNRFITYHKLINSVINCKNQIQNQIKNNNYYSKCQQLQQVQSQIVYTSRFPFETLKDQNIINQQQKIQIKINKNKNKKKFYRTTPILRSIQLPLDKTHNLAHSSTDNYIQKNWTQSSNLSSISSAKTTQNQFNNSNSNYKDSTLNIVNRLFGQQPSNQLQNYYVSNQAKNLWKKNKQFLQTLILKQKNMILEVTESQVDLQSHRSMRSPSRRNFEGLSSSILNSTRHQESQGLF